jgi:hypothetical protein
MVDIALCKCIVEDQDRPGLRHLVACWNKENGAWCDPIAEAKEFLNRRELRWKLTLVVLVLVVVGCEFVHYQLADDGYKVPLLTGLVSLFILWVFVLAESYWNLERFLDKFGRLAEMLECSMDGIAGKTPQELRMRVEERLVCRALDVRKLELANQGIPKEHWARQKMSFVKKLEALYEVGAMFDLAFGGYGPYYKLADKHLEALAVD